MNEIIFLIDDISNYGGTERVTCTLSNHLANLGFNIRIHTLNFSQNKIKFNLDNRISIIKSTLPEYIQIFKIFHYSKKNNTPVIVISMGKLSVKSGLISLIMAPYKLIFSEHISYESFSLFKKLIKKMAYLTSNYTILLTNNDKYILSKDKKTKFLCIENINPYYDKNYSPPIISNRPNIAIAIGRLSYQKNFSRLIKLWKDANISNWTLYIIGDGPERERLIELIDDDNRISLIPANNNLIKFYENAKLSIMTSRFEGLPMTLIESQYFGIPSIAFDCKTGPSEIIIDQESGYIIDYNNDFDFIKKIQYLTNEKNIRTLEKMHLKCLEYRNRYCSDVIIKKWLDIII